MSTSTCPHCGAEHDCATCPKDESAKPKPGSISVCFDCGLAAVWDDGMSLRKFTPLERLQLPPDVSFQLQRIQRAVERRLQQKPGGAS